MRLGTDTASVNNWLMAGAKQPVPKVGDGATICMWTDRHAATIVKVTPTQVHVQEDIATRTDSNGMSDCQEYSYQRNPGAEVRIFRLNKYGQYRQPSRGCSLAIGVRRSYHDFGF